MACSGAHPQGLSHQAEGRRVVRAFKDDMAVAVQFSLFPDGQIIRRTRQCFQTRFSHFLKTAARLLLGCAVNAHPSLVLTPLAYLSVGLYQFQRVFAAHEAPLTITNP